MVQREGQALTEPQCEAVESLTGERCEKPAHHTRMTTRRGQRHRVEILRPKKRITIVWED